METKHFAEAEILKTVLKTTQTIADVTKINRLQCFYIDVSAQINVRRDNMEALDAKLKCHSRKYQSLARLHVFTEQFKLIFKSISDHSWVHNTCPQVYYQLKILLQIIHHVQLLHIF